MWTIGEHGINISYTELLEMPLRDISRLSELHELKLEKLKEIK